MKQCRNRAISDDRNGRGWTVVMTCLVLTMLCQGMFMATGIFVKPVCEELGISRGSFSFARTILLGVGAVTIPFYSRWMRRIGLRKMFFLGMILLPAAIFGYSLCRSAMHFYLMGTVHGLLYNAVGFFTIGELINRIYGEKAGPVLGLVYAGSGLGAALSIPVLNRVVMYAGWQTGYRLMALIGLCAGPLLVFLFIRDIPFEEEENSSFSTGTDKKVIKENTTGIRRRQLLLIIAFFAAGMVTSSTNTHSAPYISDLGFSQETAAMFTSGLMLMVCVSKIVSGELYGRFRPAVGNAVIGAFGIIGMVLLLLCGHSSMHIPCLITLGMFHCTASVPIPILAMRYFSPGNYHGVYANVSTSSTMSSAAAVTVIGSLCDLTGSYRPAWILVLICAVINAVCLLAVDIDFAKRGKL